MIAFDPEQSAPKWLAKAMPPLWQYLAPLAKMADESIPAPKGRESRTPTDFPLHNSMFLGAREGAIIAFVGPPGKLVGEGHAPVVAVLLASAKAPSRFLL